MEREAKHGDPTPLSPRLTVQLEGLDRLHGIATGEVRTNNLRIGWTEFNDTVLRDEKTSVGAFNTIYFMSSRVRLSDSRKAQPHRGFYDRARLTTVQEVLEQQGIESEIRETRGEPAHNEIKIVRGNAVIRIDFGPRSLTDFEAAEGLIGIEHYRYNDEIFVSLDNNYDITPLPQPAESEAVTTSGPVEEAPEEYFGFEEPLALLDVEIAMPSESDYKEFLASLPRVTPEYYEEVIRTYTDVYPRVLEVLYREQEIEPPQATITLKPAPIYEPEQEEPEESEAPEHFTVSCPRPDILYRGMIGELGDNERLWRVISKTEVGDDLLEGEKTNLTLHMSRKPTEQYGGDLNVFSHINLSGARLVRDDHGFFSHARITRVQVELEKLGYSTRYLRHRPMRYTGDLYLGIEGPEGAMMEVRCGPDFDSLVLANQEEQRTDWDTRRNHFLKVSLKRSEDFGPDETAFSPKGSNTAVRDEQDFATRIGFYAQAYEALIASLYREDGKEPPQIAIRFRQTDHPIF